MAFYGRPKPKAKGTSLRLTGLFAAKKRGLFVGSTEEVDAVKDVVKRAIAAEHGLVFFLWKNPEAEEGQPNYTLYVDVSQDMDQPKSRAIIEPDDDEEEEPTPSKSQIRRLTAQRAKSDEVPF